MRSTRYPIASILRTQLASPRLSQPIVWRQSVASFSIVPFKLADIGEGIAEVELLKWFVKDGDKVKAFDKICEVQSDKATVEITSRFDGKIAKLHHSEGAIVKVGSALLDIDTGKEKKATAHHNTHQPSAIHQPQPVQTQTTSVVPFKLADIGEGIAEVELLKWFVEEGASVKAFDKICEVQSDKATVEITSRFDGKIVKLNHQVGNIVKVGASLLEIETAAAVPAAPSKDVNQTLHNEHASSYDINQRNSSGKILTTPSVRKIAKENKIDLSTVRGTGPKGRILKEDILNFIKNGHSSGQSKVEPVSASQPTATTAASSSPAAPAATAPAVTVTDEDQRVPIRGVQRLMVKSMTAANQVKHLTLGEEVTFDKMRVLRGQLKSLLAAQGIKLSYMPLIIKATSLALSQYPLLNATVNSDVTEMIYHANHNIGVAMDTPKGLIVPVIKAVQKKSIADIARELTALQEAAAKGTITEAQLSGGTFTLSNIGSVGGTYAVPVIVVPQVAIGALGRLQVVPRYVNKQGAAASFEEIDSGDAEVLPTTIMNVSWSADHRVVDGATVAKFSNVWKSYIESPELMLSQLR